MIYDQILLEFLPGPFTDETTPTLEFAHPDKVLQGDVETFLQLVRVADAGRLIANSSPLHSRPPRVS